MRDMVERAVLPDLRARARTSATIASRLLRTWGLPEAEVAERLRPRLLVHDATGDLTMAFVADPAKGITVRLTCKAESPAAAQALLHAEEREVRALLGTAVFGADDDTLEAAVADVLSARGLSLAVIESVTGGLVAARLVDVEGASAWFRGAVVAYAPQVKFDLLGVPSGPVVSEDAAGAMAEGARKVLGSDVGLSLTGVAGPDPQEGVPPGTVFVGVCLDTSTEVTQLGLAGGRSHVRQVATMSALDLLRRRLLAREG
jgi:nicotinamide-nucleotide amidase